MTNAPAYGRRCRPRNLLNGFTVVELLVAIVVLSSLMLVILQLANAQVRQQRTFDRHRRGSLACDNVMTIAMALPFEEFNELTIQQLTTEWPVGRDAVWSIQVEELSAAELDFGTTESSDVDNLVARVVSAELGDTLDDADSVVAKRLAISLDWPLIGRGATKLPQYPLLVVAWRYDYGQASNADQNDTDGPLPSSTMPAANDSEGSP